MDNVRNATGRNRWHARCGSRALRIILRNHSPSARLSRDHTASSISVTRETRRAGCGLCTCAGRAAVDIGHLDSAEFVDARPDEIEKITANIGATFAPDAASLHRVVRRRIDCRQMGPPPETLT